MGKSHLRVSLCVYIHTHICAGESSYNYVQIFNNGNFRAAWDYPSTVLSPCPRVCLSVSVSVSFPLHKQGLDINHKDNEDTSI